MLVRFAKATSGSDNYSDVDKSFWAYDSINTATAYGWITGSDGLFRPNDSITRAEVAAIMNRVLGRVPDQFFINSDKTSLKTFPDLSKTEWYYYDMIDATNGHAFDLSKSNLESWENAK